MTVTSEGLNVIDAVHFFGGQIISNQDYVNVHYNPSHHTHTHSHARTHTRTHTHTRSDIVPYSDFYAVYYKD